MFRKRYLWWSLLLMALILPACAPRARELTEADAGKTITLKSGEVFKVVLQGNPTTGYTWLPDDKATTVQVTMTEDPDFAPDSKATGSGGRIILTFKAGEVGEGLFRLAYRRPWEDVAPEKTFEVTIKIEK
jgi:inhibitor of cysteine peptidase